jgi:hypothetical protein
VSSWFNPPADATQTIPVVRPKEVPDADTEMNREYFENELYALGEIAAKAGVAIDDALRAVRDGYNDCDLAKQGELH